MIFFFTQFMHNIVLTCGEMLVLASNNEAIY